MLNGSPKYLLFEVFKHCVYESACSGLKGVNTTQWSEFISLLYSVQVHKADPMSY